MNNLEIIAMVYKSIDYTKHIMYELTKPYSKAEGWDVSFRIIANDPTNELKLFLESNSEISNFIDYYKDPKPNDYYLNRVYRCWNYGAKTSKAENICFVNSDMMFSDNWLSNLLKHHNGTKIPCSRLVESGKLISGKYAISRDFGRYPTSLDRKGWEAYSSSIVKDMAPYKGLFMPCIFRTDRFLESGGYPEGNVYADGAGTLNGPVIHTGDTWYFNKLEKDYGMMHVTVFDSLVYHIQEGEKDA